MAVEKPAIVWLPAAPGNVNQRAPGIRYECLVAHTTAGGQTIYDLGAWFGGGNIAAGVYGSTHFGVDRDGLIGQYVDLASQPIAHGQEAGATARLAHDNAGLSANAWAIGVEHLDGGAAGSVTSAQLEASAHLMAWLWQEYIAPYAALTGATLDRDHLIGHYELAPRSRPFCPSWPEARFQEQLKRIAARLAPAPVPPEPVTDYQALYLAELEGEKAAYEDDAERAAVRLETVKKKISEVPG